MFKKNTPLVSVIVPCYNVAAYLPDALNSILIQTYTYWECIIVDDGSSDTTAAIAKQYEQKDCRFHYIGKKNAGLAAARNTGIRNSIGKYILPLDGDDKIADSYLTKGVAILENTPEIKVVYCLGKYFGHRNGLWRLPDYSYTLLLFTNMIFCSCIFRRTDFNRIGGYDESLVTQEDWDFLIRLLYPEGKVYRIPEFLFFYRIRSGSLMHSSNSEKKCKMTQKMIFKKNIDIYLEYVDEDPMRIYQERYIVMTSRCYKLGAMILRPLNWISKLLFTKQSTVIHKS